VGKYVTAPYDTVLLLDVDNTLLDNDRVISDLRAHLEQEFGAVNAGRYWDHFEALRSELGYADYLGALQRWRFDAEHLSCTELGLLEMSGFLVDYPFADRLYPQALDVVRHLSASGPTVILTDGDVVFQPRKVQRSGLWDAVGEVVESRRCARPRAQGALASSQHSRNSRPFGGSMASGPISTALISVCGRARLCKSCCSSALM
jgi:FMN phosphatase YigB (HAD superfamily)